MENDIDEMCPAYELNYVYWLFEKAKKNGLIHRYADDLSILGGDVKLKESDVLVYAGNHQSLLDYLLPHYALLSLGLPYPRTVAGKNLGDFPFKQILGLDKKGMIWINREKADDFGYIRRFIRTVRSLLGGGEHILVYPEGGRNYDCDGEVKEFRRGVFDASLDAQLESDALGICRDFFILPFAVFYERIPEEKFFQAIKEAKRRGDKFKYYGLDLYSYFRWRFIERRRGQAKIKFGDKLSVRDLVKQRGLNRKSLAEFVRREVIRLKKEIS